jgi:hypothetical protein
MLGRRVFGGGSQNVLLFEYRLHERHVCDRDGGMHVQELLSVKS